MLDYHERTSARLSELDRDMRWRDGSTIRGSERIAIHRLAAEPPRTDRIGRWRTETSPADRRAFTREAGEMLETLGYEGP